MSEKEIPSSIMAEDGSTDRLVPRRKLTYLRKPQKTCNDGRKDEVKLFLNSDNALVPLLDPWVDLIPGAGKSFK